MAISEDTRQRVNDVIRATFPDFDGDITDETTAADVPGWDSIAHVTLMLQIEMEMGFQVDPATSFELRNVGELYSLVGTHENSVG